MNKCSAFILLACAFALLTAERVEAGPVAWDFIATGCSGGCISGQSYPVTLATLTLPGPDSSGTAKYEGAPGHVPIYTGDSFILNWDADYSRPGLPGLTSDYQTGAFTPCLPGNVCNFDISWSESNGQLTALSIYVRGLNIVQGLDPVIGDVLGFYDTFSSSLGGAEVASTSPDVPCLRYSDFIYHGAGGLFEGCEGPPCQISGEWVDASLVAAPEPGSFALLAGAFGVWGLIGRRCPRLIKHRARAREMRAGDQG
jgi:hypothetical protein